MRRSRVLSTFALAGLASIAPIAAVACVDLFHSTDFETLQPEAGGPDVVSTADVVDAPVKPLVDFCKWTPTEAKAAATRACAWLGSCGGVIDDTVFGPCMMHALWAYDCDLNPGLRPNGATYALWSCLSDVKSCGEVDACIRPGPQAECPAIASGSFTQCANAGAAELRVECANREAGPPSRVEPCAMQGRTCISIDDSTSKCGGPTKKTCAKGRTCTGTAAVDCDFHGGSVFVDLGLDCAAFGAGSCVSEEPGGDAGTVVGCAPLATAPACSDAGIAVACDEDIDGVARSCVGGRAISIDCRKLGAGCDVAKNVPAYQPWKACTVSTADGGACFTADECIGGKMKSCAQGITFEADCVALGLGPCEKVNNGVLARCKPP
jgi:hypothetical protein